MFSLEGKVAMVVGATQGIGQQTARRFVQAGAEVVATARSAEKLEAIASDLDATRSRVVAVAADITKERDRRILVDTAVSHFGSVDVLVNCAGGTPAADWNDVLEITEPQWDSVVELNLKSAFFLAQRVAWVMRGKGRGGVIVFLSSRSGSLANPRNAHFCASKAGVESLARSMALELGEYGIRVNAIAPGLVMTEGTRDLIDGNEGIQREGARHPLMRVGSTDDVASLAVFLASEEAGWVSGTTLAVNGGSPVPNGFISFVTGRFNR